MSMLVDKVPESLIISGTEYEINTDFRVWIKYEALLTSSENNNSDNLLDKIKKLVFKSKIPPAHLDEETIEQIIWFYRCGKEPRKGSPSKSADIFSYEYDDGYIYAAFMEQYHLDLTKEDIHWWKFQAYMLALSDSTEFVKIMGYRSIEISSKMSSEQKTFYQKMKKHYKLPVKKEVQEKYNAIEEALINGKPIDNLL